MQGRNRPLRLFDVGQDSHATLVERAPLLSEAQASGRSIEQPCLQPLLQAPNLLAYGTYAFTPKLSLDASAAYFSLSYDDYDGSLFRGTVNLEYRFNDHIGAGIGYNYTNMNLDIEDGDDTTEYDLSYTGPVVFLSAGF